VRRKLLSTLIVLSIISISVPIAFADTAIVGPADSICKELSLCDVVPVPNPQTIRDLLDALGIPQCAELDIPSPFCDAISSETTDELLVVLCKFIPNTLICDPEFVDPVNVQFEVVQDTGAFFYSYGFCLGTSVDGINPETQKQAWATACLGDPDTVEIFDDTFDDVGATEMVDLSIDDVLIFWINLKQITDTTTKYIRTPKPWHVSNEVTVKS